MRKKYIEKIVGASSLAALVWESDRGGPVGKAEKAKVASVWQT